MKNLKKKSKVDASEFKLSSRSHPGYISDLRARFSFTKKKISTTYPCRMDANLLPATGAGPHSLWMASTEQGTPKQQGKRSDIHDVCELLDEKVPLNEIARNHPSAFVKHAKGFHAYKFATQVDRVSKPYVEWRWGTTGTGKTKGAIDKHPESFYIKDGTQWWDGYEQQDAIIIDDFDGRWPFRDLLRLLDWNPYQGQTKGGYVKINSPHIYITCEFEPSTYWGGNALAQVLRRIDKVEHLATAATEVAGNTIQPLLKRQGGVILNQAYDDLEQYGDDGNLWIK